MQGKQKTRPGRTSPKRFRPNAQKAGERVKGQIRGGDSRGKPFGLLPLFHVHRPVASGGGGGGRGAELDPDVTQRGQLGRRHKGWTNSGLATERSLWLPASHPQRPAVSGRRGVKAAGLLGEGAAAVAAATSRAGCSED